MKRALEQRSCPFDTPYAVTASGQTFSLPEPFFVLATQNPIEAEFALP